MKKYELMYILKANMDEETRKALMESLHGILVAGGAEITKVIEMGLRELAYPINDEVRGYYVVLKVIADKKATDEFARLTKINANVLRHLIVVDQE